MKPLSELRSNLSFYPHEINYHLRYFKEEMVVDFDVWLPSKNMNLQRGNVWNEHQKSEIIWSMFMKRNIPRMAFLNTSPSDTMQVIDGKQRLTAMFEYLDNKFYIYYNGVNYYFKDLPDEHKRHLEFYPLAAYIIHEGSIGTEVITDQQKIDWFKFINFSGTPQDLEHMSRLSK